MHTNISATLSIIVIHLFKQLFDIARTAVSVDFFFFKQDLIKCVQDFSKAGFVPASESNTSFK